MDIIPNTVFMLKDCVTNPQAGKRTTDTSGPAFWFTSNWSPAFDTIASYSIACYENYFYAQYYRYSDHNQYLYFDQVNDTLFADVPLFEIDSCCNPQANLAVRSGSVGGIGLFWEYAVNHQYHPIYAAVQAASVPKTVLYRCEGQKNPQGCTTIPEAQMQNCKWLGLPALPTTVTSRYTKVFGFSNSTTGGFLAAGYGYTDPLQPNYLGRFL